MRVLRSCVDLELVHLLTRQLVLRHHAPHRTLDGAARIVVSNRGPHLPESMQGQLFDSLVSVRGAGARAGAPHLGLGLYVVRLVAELHQGKVSAHNDEDGVTFEMELRGMRRPEGE